MPLFFYAFLQKLGCRLASSDEGDSPQCGEMARSDRGDRRRQRLSSVARLRVRRVEVSMYLHLFLSLRHGEPCHLSTAVSVGASKLTLRDCHRQSAPSSEGG